MLDMMEEFEKNRKVEKQLYAHINFFKLILVSQLCNSNYDTFCLLDGPNQLDKLFRDIEEENICLKGCVVKDLYQNMIQLVSTTHAKTWSRSLLLDEAHEEVGYFHRVKNKDFIELLEDDVCPADIALLTELPRELLLQPEVRNSLLSAGRQKTIGERK